MMMVMFLINAALSCMNKAGKRCSRAVWKHPVQLFEKRGDDGTAGFPHLW